MTNRPEPDEVTAESMEQDADFADEHEEPTLADEPSTEEPDESVPSGMGGMEPDPFGGSS